MEGTALRPKLDGVQKHDVGFLPWTSAASSENARLGDEAPWRPFEVDQVSADGVIEKARWLLDRAASGTCLGLGTYPFRPPQPASRRIELSWPSHQPRQLRRPQMRFLQP